MTSRAISISLYFDHYFFLEAKEKKTSLKISTATFNSKVLFVLNPDFIYYRKPSVAIIQSTMYSS